MAPPRRNGSGLEGDRHEHGQVWQPLRSFAVVRAGQDPGQHRGRLSKAAACVADHAPDDSERGAASIFIFTGLEHTLPMAPEGLRFADDELAPALYFDRLKALALEHLGGSPDRHDVMVFNRLTGATLATHLTLVKPGDVVIGVSASHSHPSVIRAAAHVGAKFTDTTDVDEFCPRSRKESRRSRSWI